MVGGFANWFSNRGLDCFLYNEHSWYLVSFYSFIFTKAVREGTPRSSVIALSFMLMLLGVAAVGQGCRSPHLSGDRMWSSVESKTTT